MSKCKDDSPWNIRLKAFAMYIFFIYYYWIQREWYASLFHKSGKSTTVPERWRWNGDLENSSRGRNGKRRRPRTRVRQQVVNEQVSVGIRAGNRSAVFHVVFINRTRIRPDVLWRTPLRHSHDAAQLRNIRMRFRTVTATRASSVRRHCRYVLWTLSFIPV